MESHVLYPDDLELADGNLRLKACFRIPARDLHRAALASVKEVHPWLAWCHEGYTLEETQAWFKKCAEEWKKGAAYDFAILDSASGLFLGGCGLNQINGIHKVANLGYWVRTGQTGKGVATAATRILARFGFQELKLNRIEILVAAENIASLRVAEKVGAKRECLLRNRLSLPDGVHEAYMHSLIPSVLDRP